MGVIDKVKKHLRKERGDVPDTGAVPAAAEVSQAVDLPSTVQALTVDARHLTELRGVFSGQKWDSPVETSAEIYIWRKADEYIKSWLSNKGYAISESAVFDDCVGYRCVRNGVAYTVFMFAYGKYESSLPSGEYCSKFKSFPFAEHSIVLITCLQVDRKVTADGAEYTIGRCGRTDLEPELWRVNDINGMPILEYFPRMEMMAQTWQFMYAFNHECTDVYDCIITDDNPSIAGAPGCSGELVNDAFYEELRRMHREYGDMKRGYVRYGDRIYSAIPYVDGLGFFSWSSFDETNRMHNITRHPFDGGEQKVREFIKAGQREPENLFAHIPELIKAVPLPPTETERFSVRLLFDNGEWRRYVLPISSQDALAEVVSYKRHVFTDGIRASVSVVAHHKSRYKGYPECGSAITFKNGFFIAGTLCYLESEPYSEPELTDEVVYSDEKRRIRKLWTWNVKAMYEDDETGLLKVLITGDAFNSSGKSVFASVDGKRMTPLTFDYIESFQEDRALVAIRGHGFGFADEALKLVVPMKYDWAESFREGKAIVRRGSRWFSVDESGREGELGAGADHANYQAVGRYCEGMCRVSTLKLDMIDLAYHSDYADIAGTWGFVNEAGKEIISPQYIYANDFEDGIAVVAKGKWTIDPKWDNEYNQGRYWTEQELWGAIDKAGNEVIPFIFDEIKYFYCRSDILRVHYGGWDNGRWGVVDREGNWLTDPIFADLGYESRDNLITFYAENTYYAAEDVPMGIYDLAGKKVLFEPQFLDVEFCTDGDIKVEVYDPELGRTIEKIIDLTGKERFKSVYSYINPFKEPYEVSIRDEDGDKRGLIDRDGNVILPCIYNIPWMSSICRALKLFCFEENGKQGIKAFDGSIIVPAVYDVIHALNEPLFIAELGDGEHRKSGLITPDGKPVLPPRYDSITWCRDHKHFFTCTDTRCEMYIVENLDNAT